MKDAAITITTDTAPSSDDDTPDISPEEQALLDRIKAADEARRNASAEREEKARLRELEVQLERTEQAAKDEAALAKLEDKYGALNVKLRHVNTIMGMIVVKRPNPVSFRKFQDTEDVKTLDLEKLVQPCVVYPKKSRFNRIISEQPAVLIQCANAVSWLAGARKKKQAGK